MEQQKIELGIAQRLADDRWVVVIRFDRGGGDEEWASPESYADQKAASCAMMELALSVSEKFQMVIQQHPGRKPEAK